MTPYTNAVFICTTLQKPPAKLSTDGDVCLLMLRNWGTKLTKTNGRFGPDYCCLLVGRGAAPDMPIWTARPGSTLFVCGMLESYWSPKAGAVRTVIKSGYVNIIRGPGGEVHEKFANPENFPIDMGALLAVGDILVPDATNSIIEDIGEFLDHDPVVAEKDYTEKLMANQLLQRERATKVKEMRKRYKHGT